MNISEPFFNKIDAIAPTFERDGNLRKVGRLQFEQRSLKASDKLQPCTVPSKVIGENVGDRLHVVHVSGSIFSRDRDWCHDLYCWSVDPFCF